MYILEIFRQWSIYADYGYRSVDLSFWSALLEKWKSVTLLLIGQMMFEADGNILNGTWFEGVRHGDFELSNTEEGASFQMSYEMGRFGQ